MSKIKKLAQARSLLSQALSIASECHPNDKHIDEARGQIRRAMGNIDEATKTTSVKKVNNDTNYQKWWGNIQSGVGSGTHTKESAMKSLKCLNAMIAEEQKKIDDMENLAPAKSPYITPTKFLLG